MTPADIRRLMRRELDQGALSASLKNEQIALGTLRLLIERGVIRRLTGSR